MSDEMILGKVGINFDEPSEIEVRMVIYLGAFVKKNLFHILGIFGNLFFPTFAIQLGIDDSQLTHIL